MATVAVDAARETMATQREHRTRSGRAAPAPVAAMAGLMAGGAAGLNLVMTGPHFAVSASFLRWAVLLGFAFWLVEVVPIHLEWAGQAYSMSLSEVPLVMGLFFCPSPLLVVARVVGGGIALACSRKQPPHKLAFNVALQSLEASLALTIFLALPQHAAAGPMSAAPAALVAVMASSVASMLAVSAAVRLSVGELDSAILMSFLRSGTFAIVVNTSIALVLTTALRSNSSVALPMIVMLLAAGAVYRAYVALRQRHSGLEMLYQFTSGLNQTTTTDHRIRDILDRTRGILRADTAGLLLMGSSAGEPPVLRWTGVDGTLHTQRYVEGPTDGPFARVVDDGEVVVIGRSSRSPVEQAFVEGRGFRDAALAPLRLDGQVRGALFVADRQGDVASFTTDDARLFQTVAAQVSSVLDNSRLLDRLTHDSLHDALTGLANRQCFQSRLRQALTAPRPAVAVMLTDLDRFKEINDTLGHHHGDLLIREIAARIAETAPAIATVARLGGDEFALLIPGLDTAGALELAQRIRAAIAAPCTLDGVSVDVDASIGIAVGPEHGTNDSVLLKRADTAMYAAKSARSGVEIYDSERDEYSPRRLALASRLRSAIENDEMVLYYQPQVDIATGAIVGAEALIRWQHPEYGLVPPVEFVPIAEQSGAIGELTQWVLDNAVAQLAEWRDCGLEVNVSVNASMRNLLDASLAERIAHLLHTYRLEPSALTIEITESHLMSDPARTLPLLDRLAALGVRLSVDDFGTGYSSLAYLNELPVHEVKIDKSFLRTDADGRSNTAIVRAIVSMSQHLGLETVAEGIEDEAAERSVAEIGCTRLQGYHVARPMPAGDLPGWIAARTVPVPRTAPFVRLSAV
jgi:diguanylate cyclase (GGDEF)-like protein